MSVRITIRDVPEAVRDELAGIGDAVAWAIDTLDLEAVRAAYRRQGELTDQGMTPLKRFVSDLEDAISYCGFREVFRRMPARAGGIAEDACSP